MAGKPHCHHHDEPGQPDLISAIAVSGGQAVLTATGTLGPDYTVWASTNLVNWQALMTSNSPALPVSLVDTNFSAHPQRFYRIQIGP